jgi:hypothetical protein
MEPATVVPHAAAGPQTTVQDQRGWRPRRASTDPLAVDTAGQPSSWERLPLASGGAFVVAMIALAPLAPLPLGPEATTAQLGDWFETHRAAVVLQASLRGVAGLLQLTFMVGLVGVVARGSARW